MVKFICDICEEETTRINTIILHKRKIDYCGRCASKAKQIEEDFREMIQEHYIDYEERLKKKEEKFYCNLRGGTNEQQD